jgi:hypothetical protein
MDEATRQLVRWRAGERCEYCRLPQSAHEERFSVDHIIARKHGGDDSKQNLALCCLRCNLHKGTDLTSIDPHTKQVVRLFNPRDQQWSDHFRWEGPQLRGRTSVGRATVALLQMNGLPRLRLRESLIAEGLFPVD